MPKAVVCYICGRSFGTASIVIHVKSCKKKWEIEQQEKPLSLRKPQPVQPDEFESVLKPGATREQIDHYNQSALDQYNQKSLEACPNCKRTFFHEALLKHLKSCGTAE